MDVVSFVVVASTAPAADKLREQCISHLFFTGARSRGWQLDGLCMRMSADRGEKREIC